MLTVKKEQKGAILYASLEGVMDETVRLDRLIQETPTELHVNCRRIERINSMGVQSWIRFFEKLTSKGMRLRFLQCSPVMVEQLNQVINFSAGAEIESFCLPYICEACHAESVSVVNSAKIKEQRFTTPNLKCPKCGGVAVFDELPDLYFSFLME